MFVDHSRWRSGCLAIGEAKAKFMLINLPFKTLAAKKLSLKKRMAVAIYMEETGEAENLSS